MRNSKGFTFIDVLIGVFLLLIVFLGVFGAFQLGLKVIGLSKNKIIATALANQKIETARNLPYKDVGTVGGGPEGIFGDLQDEIATTTNNIEYKIMTAVYFVDDCADGTLAEKEECPEKAGQDNFPNDYKKVRVRVSWAGRFEGEVILTTDIAPKGLELAEGYGVLDISVFNASGQAVEIDLLGDQPPPCPLTSIQIINENTGLNYCYKTDANGSRRLILPKSEPSEDYQIIVNKAGFSQDRTYGTDEIANPSKPHATVLEGKLTEISFSIDKLSTKKVDTVIPNVAFQMQGTKIKGADEDGNPVFKYSITISTDAQGKAEITNLEWDLYTITVSGTSTGYDISASDPPQPVDIPPGATTSVVLTLVPHANHTLLVTVTDTNNIPLEGATTTLSKTGYEKTLITGKSGQSFFTPLSEATYDLEVTFTGYAAVTSSVEVSGQTEARIIMTLP